jgi:hypothetical protein
MHPEARPMNILFVIADRITAERFATDSMLVEQVRRRRRLQRALTEWNFRRTCFAWLSTSFTKYDNV